MEAAVKALKWEYANTVVTRITLGKQWVTPIGAVLTAETGDTTRSPGRVYFFLSVMGSLCFFEASFDPLEGGVITAHKTIQLTCNVVTGSPAILRCCHGVTAKFRWTQIVSPVSAVSTVPMGVTTPCNNFSCWY